jgi:hypothetical protein
MEDPSALQYSRRGHDQWEERKELAQALPRLRGREALVGELARGRDELAGDLPGQDAVRDAIDEVQRALLAASISPVAAVDQDVGIKSDRATRRGRAADRTRRSSCWQYQPASG